MGACGSKKSAPSPTEEPKPAEYAKPKIFALMRNAHEVIRGAMEDCLACSTLADLDSTWRDLMRFQTIHAAMEDGNEGGRGMFALLKENFGEEETASLFKQHAPLHDTEHAIDAALAKDGAEFESVKKMVNAYVMDNECHLQLEEDIMMPKVMSMVKQGVNLKTKMTEDLLPCAKATGDFEFFVTYAMRVLEAHPGNMPRARVFSHALQAVSTPEEKVQQTKWIKDSLSEELMSQIEAEVGPGVYIDAA